MEFELTYFCGSIQKEDKDFLVCYLQRSFNRNFNSIVPTTSSNELSDAKRNCSPFIIPICPTFSSRWAETSLTFLFLLLPLLLVLRINHLLTFRFCPLVVLGLRNFSAAAMKFIANFIDFSSFPFSSLITRSSFAHRVVSLNFLLCLNSSRIPLL